MRLLSLAPLPISSAIPGRRVADVQLKCLVASTRGHYRKTIPDWSTYLADSGAFLTTLDFSDAQVKLRDTRLQSLLLLTEFRDKECLFRSVATNAWQSPITGELERFGGRDFRACVDKTVQKLRSLEESFPKFNADEVVPELLAKAIHAAKPLKSLLSRADVRRKGQGARWIVEYCDVADDMSFAVEALDKPLKLLSDESLRGYFRRMERIPLAVAFVQAAIDYLATHYLGMLEYDTAVLRMLQNRLPMDVISMMAMSYITESLAVMVGGLLIATDKRKHSRVSNIWDEIKLSNNKIGKLKTSVISLPISEEFKSIGDCKAWRHEQLKQVYLIHQLTSLV